MRTIGFYLLLTVLSLVGCCPEDEEATPCENQVLYLIDNIKIRSNSVSPVTVQYGLDGDTINDVDFIFTRTLAYVNPDNVMYFNWKVKIRSSLPNVSLYVGQVLDTLTHDGNYLSGFDIINETLPFEDECLIFENHYYSNTPDFYTRLIAFKINKEEGVVLGWIHLDEFIIDHGGSGYFYIRDHAMNNCLNQSILVGQTE